MPSIHPRLVGLALFCLMKAYSRHYLAFELLALVTATGRTTLEALL